MTEIVNTGQSEAWNGYEGEHWARHYERYDDVNRGYNEVLLEAAGVGAGDRILDIGCGNGELTREAARRARVATGVDLSGPMLARARDRAAAEGVGNVAFVQGDAQVHPFPGGGFDAALSRFGIMFFADPVVAFANVARALRPGGRLAFVTMPPLGDSDLGRVFDAAAAHLDTFGVGHTGGPMADPDGLRKVLSEAGFTGIDVEYREADGIWGRDVPDASEFLMGWGPVRYHRSLAGFSADTAVRESISAALTPFATPGGVRLRGSAYLVTATTPPS